MTDYERGRLAGYAEGVEAASEVAAGAGYEQTALRILALRAPSPAAGAEAFPPPEPRASQILPCGCVTCICDDDERCYGCGAREAAACYVSRTTGGPRHALAPSPKEDAMRFLALGRMAPGVEGEPASGYGLHPAIVATPSPAAGRGDDGGWDTMQGGAAFMPAPSPKEDAPRDLTPCVVCGTLVHPDNSRTHCAGRIGGTGRSTTGGGR